MPTAWFQRSLAALPSWPLRGVVARDLLDEIARAPLQAQVLEHALETLRSALPQWAADPLEQTAIALRYLRQLTVMSVILRDTSGRASLEEVTASMSDLAALACSQLLPLAARQLAERWGLPLDENDAVQDLHVLAMGKAGGRELNVSSDLDIVFVCRGSGGTRMIDGRSATRASEEFMHRLASDLIRLLTERDAAGFIFRVDTRLRPHGDSGPLVVNLNMLEHYFYAEGREWERFAWLKANALAHSALGTSLKAEEDLRQLQAIVQPFVFRRYLDYQAIAALRRLHRLIAQEVAKADARKGGWDVKLGRGGIREIEFIAQLFQIVRGGRDPGLRAKQTLTTLAALGERGMLSREQAAALSDGYTFFRQLEHAIQYRDDEQTHRLPDDQRVQGELAALLRLTPEHFAVRVETVRSAVAAIFDSLLAPEAVEADQVPQAPELASAPAARLEALRNSSRWRAAQEEARMHLESIVEKARRQSPTEEALVRLIDLLESVLRRPGYLALLDAYPAALRRVLALMGRARWSAQYLLRHPVVLDELLDGQILEPVDTVQWAAQQGQQLQGMLKAGQPDDERRMDHLREAHHAQVFRLLVQDLEGRLSLERLSDHLSELADQVIGLVIGCAWASLKGRHRDAPRFAAIAYGKLGGKELGYASDLDLVFVYDDPHPQAASVYCQLAVRISSWMSMQTAAGQLFEVDVRLRPDGVSGLAAISLAGLANYLKDKAWVWEHQALTRARCCAGDAALAAEFEALRRGILSRMRAIPALASEVLAMRKRMHAGHPNRSQDFDLKHDVGGMVDIEFISQFLVLAHSSSHPQLLDNVGNIALLQRAADAGLVDAALAIASADAYRRYRSLQHGLRLNEARYARVTPEEVAREAQAVRALWAQVFEPQTAATRL